MTHSETSLPPLLAATLRVQQAYEPTSAQDGVLGEMQRAFAVFAAGGRPEGIALAGESGVGKSSTIRRLRRWATEQWPGRPLYVIETTGGATPKSLAGDILAAAGDPFAQSGSEAARMARVAKLVRETQPIAIVFDEFHQLFDGNTPQKSKNAAQFVKALWNLGQAVIVLVGLDSLAGFVQASPELKRRFPVILNLGLCRPSNLTAMADLRRLLTTIDALVPRAPGVSLSSDQGVTLMVAASRGSLDSVMSMVTFALRDAHALGHPALDWSHFSRALRKLSLLPKSGLDPFTASYEEVLREAATATCGEDLAFRRKQK